MAKKKYKETSTKLKQQLRRRAVGTVVGRLNFIRSTLFNRLTTLIPTPLRWMVPFLQSELGLRPPTFDELTQKLRGEEEKVEELDPALKEAMIVEPRDTCLYLAPIYQKYDCPLHNPFNCKMTEQTVEEDEDQLYCSKCGFPAILAPSKNIRGRKGRYEVVEFLGHRNQGRIYRGLEVPTGNPVIIKEYLLPEKYFNEAEIHQRQEVFEHLAGLSLSDGRNLQDFRVITPFEAIAEVPKKDKTGRELNLGRCYVIIKPESDQAPDQAEIYQGNGFAQSSILEGAATLADYLNHNQMGALNQEQVWKVLDQVLQSLEFLHSQKFQYPNEQVVKGQAHGNLTLESLIINSTFQGFFIYLTDLALWESRFQLPGMESVSPSLTQDLQDLGRIGFYLLAGRQVNEARNALLDPEDPQNWSETVAPQFKKYLQKLMGIGGEKGYNSASEAHQNLLKLQLFSSELSQSSFSELEEEPKKPRRKWSRFWLWLLGFLGVFLLGFLIWFWGFRNRQPSAVSQEPFKCCIDQVSGIPKGQFFYTAEENGLWDYIFNERNLIILSKTLAEEIQQQQPELKIQEVPSPSPEMTINLVKNRQVNFAITSQIEDLDNELETQIFAYDGLVIFIPFSSANRQDSLTSVLKGKISIHQLQQLYTGKIQNWSQLGGIDLPVQLYLPQSEEAIAIFETRILQEQKLIDEFRQLRAQVNQPYDGFTRKLPAIKQEKNTFQTLRQMIGNFETQAETQQVGGIGFDSLSKVFGQCSIYPLALTQDQFTTISPLVEKNNQQPITPQTDLCKKGSYFPNISAFTTQDYALSYPLAVVYLRDNRQPPIGEKFAEILTTEEAQQMLFKTGLVPIQPFD